MGGESEGQGGESEGQGGESEGPGIVVVGKIFEVSVNRDRKTRKRDRDETRRMESLIM